MWGQRNHLAEGRSKYQALWNCGRGSNTHGELLALWMLIWIVQSYKMLNLQILGDSKVIVDWANNKILLWVISLEAWKQKVKKNLDALLQVENNHIWREYNMDSDSLSKQSLLLDL